MKLRHVIVFLLLALATRDAVGASDSIMVTVDTLCDGFNICVTDNTYDGGIELIKLRSAKGWNVKLDPFIDSNGQDSVVLFDHPKHYCFRVYTVDFRRNRTVNLYIENKRKFTQTKFFSVKALPVSFYPNIDKVYDFGDKYLQTSTIRQFSVNNLPTSKYLIDVENVKLSNTNPSLKVSILSDSFPKELLPGQSFVYKLDFSPVSLTPVIDTLSFTTDCFVSKFIIQGNTNTWWLPIKTLDFGTPNIGDTVCASLEIVNDSAVSIRITQVDLIHYNTNAISKSTLFSLPVVAWKTNPARLEFCYAPKRSLLVDSVVVRFTAETGWPLKSSVIGYAVLKGIGPLQRIYWSDKILTLEADSLTTTVKSTNFNHEAISGTLVKRFYISGKDSAEFRIHNSLSALSNVTMLRNETDWFDIAFKPDMTKPLSERYKDRHATLVAELKDSNVTMELIGTFNPLHVKHELTLEDFSFSPNPVYGQDATLSFTLVEPTQLAISIYDILGREVMSIPSQHYSVGSYNTPIATSKLVEGAYILRVSDGVLTKSISFRVQ